jgi:surface polysaccharide O-acyltransferase-like enzyme
MTCHIIPPTPDKDAGAAVVAPPSGGARFADIHRLRGVAIVFIVAAHCYSCFTFAHHRLAEAAVCDWFDNSTVIFMFIAGFLFQHVDGSRPYGGYLMRKAKNVLLPYLVALTPAIVYTVLQGRSEFPAPALRDGPLVVRIFYLGLYPAATLNYALWFMPVIVIYYVASVGLKRLDRQGGYWLLAILLPLSVLMHRPTFGHGHNFFLALYFLSAWVFGMFCCRYRERVLASVDRHLKPLLVAFVVFFVAHLLLSHHHGRYTTPEPFHTHGDGGIVDWLFLQKLLMTLVMLGLIRRFQHRPAAVLEYLGDKSFTIFFFHLYVIFAVRFVLHLTSMEFRADYFLMLLAVSIGACCLLATVSRRLFPDWSRSLVGA